jgi:putative transposase
VKATYWTGAHTTHRLRYHLVWIPKYRKRVLQGKVAYRLRGLFYEACKVNDWWIHEMAIMPDHVHLLIQLPANLSVAEVVQRLKGGTSRVLRKEYPELEEFLWGDSFWCDGYFAETVGRLQESSIRNYIKNQYSSMPGKK